MSKKSATITLRFELYFIFSKAPTVYL